MDQNCPIGFPFPKLQLCSVQVYILILHSSISCVTIQKACKIPDAITASLFHEEH